MMQNTDFKTNRHSLFNAMDRFITAATDMDETIMVPTLLRDLSLEEEDNPRNWNLSKHRDLYQSYQLLKSIRNDMEWGVLNGETNSNLEPRNTGEEAVEGGDLQGQFRHHLNGLFCILSKLTLQANHLTSRYQKEVGCNNLGS
uniref:Mid1-interacting protein 1-like n=1 Tax=Callorhinchus milii TaxID=7868 RepID=V9L0M9_CALMI|eukprot:gi/632935371/ref/XP_007889825.1/ PREDICTED: mid1-interacting protein 1-like [Callorhinchus milii]